VDWDCNGIADSWEGQYTTPTGGHLAPALDGEQGYGGNTNKGDGWSNHDEYRGFHYVADDGTTVKWTSTDPVNKFDVFFWEVSVLPTDPSELQTYTFTNGLRDVLCLQGTPAEMGDPSNPASNVGEAYCRLGINDANTSAGLDGPNPLRYLYRRVNAAQAHARDAGSTSAGVRDLNSNSLTAQSDSTRYHTAVVYNSKSLNPSYAIVPGQTTTWTTGITRNLSEGTYTDPHFFRVDVDPQAILVTSSYYRFPQPTMFAQVVAHETGHLFGQYHPVRPNNCCKWVSTNPSSLPASNYTFPNNGNSTSATILIGIAEYIYNPTYPNGSPFHHDRQTLAADCALFPDGSCSSGTLDAGVNNPAIPIHTVAVPQKTLAQFGQATKAWTIPVQIQQLELMDWAPNLNLLRKAQWHFDSTNLNALCARNPCN
jgi:hypothetical protein